jgi:hypothetical protein
MGSHDRKKDQERTAVENMLRKFFHVFWAGGTQELPPEPSENPDWVVKDRSGRVVGAIECAKVQSDMKQREKARRLDSLRAGCPQGEVSSDEAVRQRIVEKIVEKEGKAKGYKWPAAACTRVLLLSINAYEVGMTFTEVAEIARFGWEGVKVEQFDHVFVHDEATGEVYRLPVCSKRGRT